MSTTNSVFLSSIRSNFLFSRRSLSLFIDTFWKNSQTRRAGGHARAHHVNEYGTTSSVSWCFDNERSWRDKKFSTSFFFLWTRCRALFRVIQFRDCAKSIDPVPIAAIGFFCFLNALHFSRVCVCVLPYSFLPSREFVSCQMKTAQIHRRHLTGR